MIQPKEYLPIPTLRKTNDFHLYLRDTLSLLKKNLPAEKFLEILSKIGIQSRVSYRRLMAGKRHFDPNKLAKLSDALDLSYSERQILTS